MEASLLWKKKLFQQIFLTRKRSNSHVPDIIYKYDISMFDLTVTSWVKLWVQFSWSELHNKTHNSVFTDKSLINIIGFLFLTWALTSHLACMKYLETNKSSSATTEIRRPAILCWATNEHSYIYIFIYYYITYYNTRGLLVRAQRWSCLSEGCRGGATQPAAVSHVRMIFVVWALVFTSRPSSNKHK